MGEFATNTLLAESAALASGTSSDDSKYANTEKLLSTLSKLRDPLAQQIKTTLSKAAFDQVAPGPVAPIQLLACRLVVLGSKTIAPH